jgi:hypothetical protein
LQTYRAQIKNFLETHKPYFIHDGTIYPIEDIASYHIHAGDYYRKSAPKGGHSNPGGNNLNYFNPQVNKYGPLGTQDVIFYNSRNIHITKPSSLYPANWSELVCDLKAIEMMMSNKIKIIEDPIGTLTLFGKTSDCLEIIIHYDIAQKRIKSHYPDSEAF